MTFRPLPDNELVLDLLADEATVGLTDRDLGVLHTYFAEHPHDDDDGLIAAAAAIDLATLPRVDSAPASLVARLGEQAERQFATTLFASSQRETATAVRWRRYALAAMILIAASGWWFAISGSQGAQELPASDQLAMLEAEAPDVIHAGWTPKQPGYEKVHGEVVWSDTKQAGFMLLEGLPANQPTSSQYQLWIVDPQRDAKPVDGGVFDVPTSGEAIVPIHAKLQVSHPNAFAITREKPGGVVVSEGPLLVVAVPKG